MWAVIGAAVCGVAVATVSGGGASKWSLVLLALLPGIGIVVTALVGLQRYAQHRAFDRGPVVPPHVDEQLSERQVLSDRETVDALLSRINKHDLDWLRTEQFRDLWRDDRTATFRALAELGAGRSGIFDADLASAVDTLTDAARAFFDVYDSQTVPDPIMRDGSWRMVGPVDPDSDGRGMTEADRIGSRSRLRVTATTIVESNDVIVGLVMREPSGGIRASQRDPR